MKTAAYWIKKLDLKKHPEGGWFTEIYRSKEIAEKQALPVGFSGERNFSTSIYYLLEGDDFSAFHRIKSDEIWHFYAGNSAVEILSIENGKIKRQFCGNSSEENQFFQVVIHKNIWFAASLQNKNGYALVGCTVSPGFHFDDFEFGTKTLVEQYPELEKEIDGLIKH